AGERIWPRTDTEFYLLLSCVPVAARITPRATEGATLLLPLHDIVRQGDQLGGGDPLERGFGVVRAGARQRPGAGHTEEGGIRGLAQPLVAPGSLAQGALITHYVQNVVGDLEGKPQRFAVGGQALQVARAAVRGDPAEAEGGGEQGACLGPVDLFQPPGIRLHPFRFQVPQLATDHSGGTGGTTELGHERAAHLARQPQTHRPFLEDAHRQREQRGPRQRRLRHPEDPVYGRPTPPQVVVVHAGEIVVHQRIRVDDLEGGGEPIDCGALLPAYRSIRRQAQDRADPLSTRRQGVLDG